VNFAVTAMELVSPKFEKWVGAVGGRRHLRFFFFYIRFS
jgi:hypothetical protein